MTTTKDRAKNYVWVKNVAGNEFLCPVDALKKSEDATEEELRNCIDVEALRPYLDE